MPGVTATRTGHTMGGKGHTMVGSGVGILKRHIHTLLTLTRGHSTTVRDVTGNPCERSIWSLCSLYSLDALTLTPSSRSTGTACDRLEYMCTVPSITTRQCALPSPRRRLIYIPDSTCCAAPRSKSSRTGHGMPSCPRQRITIVLHFEQQRPVVMP